MSASGPAMSSRPCRPREIRRSARVCLRRRWSIRASFSMMPAMPTGSSRRFLRARA